MKRAAVKPSWAVAFFLAIILPALVLSFLALRALDREEAYLEKQFEKSYLSEVRLEVADIINRLQLMKDELSYTAPTNPDEDLENKLNNWKNENSLVEVPFYISEEKEILYPKVNEKLSQEEISFLNWNRDFVKDKVAIPVYQNIALYYQEVVLSESQKLEKQKQTEIAVSSSVNEDTKTKDQRIVMDKKVQNDPVPEKEFLSEPTSITSESVDVEESNDAFLSGDTHKMDLDELQEILPKVKNQAVEKKSLRSRDDELESPVTETVSEVSDETADDQEIEIPSSKEMEISPEAEEFPEASEILESIVQQAPQSQYQEEEMPIAGLELQDELEKESEIQSREKDMRSMIKEELEPSEAPVLKKREEQKALEKFEKYEEVRNLIYDQASEEGQERLQRNVAPIKGGNRLVTDAPESIFITEPLNFTEIISKADQGIIPRFIEEQLKLLFWKKDTKGNILGCLLDNENLISYVSESIEEPYDEHRMITILDDTGHPLILPESAQKLDWRVPFISREISEILPRWEVAVYLSNPASISQEARNITILMAAMIALLIVSIILGGLLFLRAFYLEMDLAAKKTSFVANVSHELKTPLTSIRMFAEMLKEKRQKNPAKREKYLSLMLSETERLSRLVNNVLDFSKMNQGKRKYQYQSVNISTVSEEVLMGQKMRLESSGFKVIFSAPEKPIIYTLDPEAFGQCLINLITNSEKYSAETKEIQLKLHQTSDCYCIDILDRGIGIDKSQAKKIFRAFYRVDDSLTAKISGSGLGLSISKKIIKDMGGDMEYFSRKGGGSVFRIIFPIERKE